MNSEISAMASNILPTVPNVKGESESDEENNAKLEGCACGTSKTINQDGPKKGSPNAPGMLKKRGTVR